MVGKRLFRIGFFGVLTVTIGALFLLAPSGLTPYCPNQVSAQDNPCLAQEATISSMQIALLQSTLDSLNAQATIGALEGALASAQTGSAANVGAPPPLVIGLPFTETFDDNSRGWELFSNANSAARLSQGQLMMSVDDDYAEWVEIPSLPADEFFLDVSVTPYGRSGFVGFGLGQTEDAAFQHLVDGRGNGRWSTAVIEVGSRWTWHFVTDYTSVLESAWQEGAPLSLSLELKNGLYTLYINGSVAESVPAPAKPLVTLTLLSQFGDFSAAFDNVTVRASR